MGVRVVGSYTATETLPSGVTADDLMSSAVYVGAKKTGLSVALSVDVGNVDITGHTVGSRRLSAVGRQLTAAVSVTTQFAITVSDSSTAQSLSTTIAGAADDISTHTNAAMAAADWSSESVITSAPTLANVAGVAASMEGDSESTDDASGAVEPTMAAAVIAVIFVAACA